MAYIEKKTKHNETPTLSSGAGKQKKEIPSQVLPQQLLQFDPSVQMRNQAPFLEHLP